jgi:hypothetical protein
LKRCILRSRRRGRLMRILGAVVLPPPALMAGANPKIMGGGSIRAQIVDDQSIGDEPAFLQEFGATVPHRIRNSRSISTPAASSAKTP